MTGPADADLPRFALLRTLFYQITDAMQKARPQEGCGLLFECGSTQIFYQVRNVAGQTDRFVMDPDELLGRMQWAENHGFGLAAIVHSHVHPAPARPSLDDTAMAAQYPDVAQLLVSVGRFAEWYHEISAWRYRRGELVKVGLVVPDSTAIGTATNRSRELNGIVVAHGDLSH